MWYVWSLDRVNCFFFSPRTSYCI